MTNEFYNESGAPSTSSAGSSAAIRAEFALIAAGFAKLPTMTGNGGEILAINSGGTSIESLATTGTGSAVRATSPTLVTPTLGVDTATSINKVTLTTPDRRFTIRTVACFGQCALAPVVEVNHAIRGHVKEQALMREVDKLKKETGR